MNEDVDEFTVMIRIGANSARHDRRVACGWLAPVWYVCKPPSVPGFERIHAQVA